MSKFEDLMKQIEEFTKQNLGASLIAKERHEKQIKKHGFTGKHHAEHPEWYDKGQLIEAAHTLSVPVIKSCLVPLNWDAEWFKNMCDRDHEERLVISGALIAAEIDRLAYLKNNPEQLK